MTQLRHDLLSSRGIEHGFALRDEPPAEDIARPRQVHGARVVRAEQCAAGAPPEADAVVCDAAGVRVGVVTADCVPVLAASADGTSVAAIHAGWRGLARGVVEAGLRELRSQAGPGIGLIAVIGPHIGPCCYEVDAPVLDALGGRFGAAVGEATVPVRPGHVRLDLARLVRLDLQAAGIPEPAIGGFPGLCTACDGERFHSFRRDGERAGRMQHFIAALGAAIPRPT